MFEFRNGEQSMRLTLLRYDWLRVVRISHLSGEWKRHCDRTRRESDKSITIVDSHFNANSTYFISVQLLLLLLSSIRVWVSKWRTINAIHFVTIRLVVEIGHLSDKWKRRWNQIKVSSSWILILTRILHILYLYNFKTIFTTNIYISRVTKYEFTKIYIHV